MKILTSSCSKIVVDGTRDSGFLFSRNLNLSRPEIYAVFSKKAFSNVRFLHVVSMQHRGICAISASSSISPGPEADLETAEAEIPEKNQWKTIHVKFQLQKECVFGDQIFIVGDEPMFGLWDPESAIPLNWSDGHVWNVDLDVPIGKPILYKFILKGSTGNILWQPGPDRVFKPWETMETITVREDWEDADLQKITEEAAAVNSELLIAENFTYEKQELVPNLNQGGIVDDISSPTRPLTATHKEQIVGDVAPPQEKSMAMVADNIEFSKGDSPMNSLYKTVPGEERISPKEEFMTTANKNMVIEEGILGNNGRSATLNNSESERNLVTQEGEPVLVPGLTPLSVMSAEPDEDERRITIDGSVDTSEVKSPNFPEFDEKHQPVDDDLHQEGMTGMFSEGDGQPENEKLLSAKEQQPDTQLQNHNVWHNDISWGRTALQKLLTSIGFLKFQ
ncbi:uncharacterized protein LOC119987567 [Tripterygium wilfordii]|uniref:uncharacterized protein LOC119987567 n=1 Tax=Tripterygium wilfordii TaxID=458696 RepID=UPI0018F82173|nr:uncharacterized protein LOC119987567 [Tripterygium wilfordii]